MWKYRLSFFLGTLSCYSVLFKSTFNKATETERKTGKQEKQKEQINKKKGKREKQGKTKKHINDKCECYVLRWSFHAEAVLVHSVWCMFHDVLLPSFIIGLCWFWPYFIWSFLNNYYRWFSELNIDYPTWCWSYPGRSHFDPLVSTISPIHSHAVSHLLYPFFGPDSSKITSSMSQSCTIGVTMASEKCEDDDIWPQKWLCLNM